MKICVAVFLCLRGVRSGQSLLFLVFQRKRFLRAQKAKRIKKYARRRKERIFTQRGSSGLECVCLFQ